MSAPLQTTYITEQEYRDGEEISEVKHEWFDGRVYAMAGGTYNHSTICNSVATGCTVALRGRPCKARGSELRVKIESNGLETYPDAVIFCPPSRFTGRGDSTLLTPTVIFEVLSNSTRNHDRTSKFRQYKTIPTFMEYVLIEQDHIWVDHYRRVGEDWLHSSYVSRSDILKLESVGIELSLDEIYEELELPEPLLSLEPPVEEA